MSLDDVHTPYAHLLNFARILILAENGPKFQKFYVTSMRSLVELISKTCTSRVVET